MGIDLEKTAPADLGDGAPVEASFKDYNISELGSALLAAAKRDDPTAYIAEGYSEDGSLKVLIDGCFDVNAVAALFANYVRSQTPGR